MRNLALLLLLLTVPARAATLAGTTFPDRYPVQGQTLALNGLGLRTLTILRVRVYVAALYLPRPSHDANEIASMPGPKVLVLQFLHAGSKADIEKEYREGEHNNCGNGECNPADEGDFNRLVAAAPAVAVGDTTTFIFTGTGLRMLANNRPVIDIPNKSLADRILAGFIGSHPPSESLRDSLLGRSDG